MKKRMYAMIIFLIVIVNFSSCIFDKAVPTSIASDGTKVINDPRDAVSFTVPPEWNKYNEDCVNGEYLVTLAPKPRGETPIFIRLMITKGVFDFSNSTTSANLDEMLKHMYDTEKIKEKYDSPSIQKNDVQGVKELVAIQKIGDSHMFEVHYFVKNSYLYSYILYYNYEAPGIDKYMAEAKKFKASLKAK